MKKVEISARFMSGFVGLVVCYALSIYFFWDSQISINGFRVDPEHSRVTKALYFALGRDNAKPVGVVLAFLSVHASWAWRYLAGDIIERLWRKFFLSKQDNISVSNHDIEMPNKNMIHGKKELSQSLDDATYLPGAPVKRDDRKNEV
ncbi:hypothetical protein ACU6U9_21645 [Pseudomonas sp. HK3]|jgi:hypothetical protein